ncbi:MAG: 4Fe-4S dicluster domain-containing protein [Spirochaetes bacterium]|nr:4Fe-4S dicluster domain-containing protein [Spirochaetota bacterium]
MADTGFLPKEKLKDFLEALSKDAVVYAPALEGDIVLFKEYSQGKDLYLDRPANLGPKSIIYPQCETLLSFDFKKNDPEDPKKVDIELKTESNFANTVVFGCRPCDAKGLVIYDKVFIDTDTADPYYKERRDKTTIISFACEAPFAGCFCTAVGGGPADTTGSDVLMTDVGDGFFFEALTEKGKAVLKSVPMQDGASYKEKAQKIKSEAEKKIRNPFPKDATEKLSQKLFDSDEFWEKVVSKCISCGACTYLCPTCYCFNITDEKTKDKGERIRTWDACMFNHFTLETSGHNPRPSKLKRFRNRVGHKFLYYPEKYNGVIACCGCGRCIRYCPASVDISEIVGYLKDPKQK